MAVRRYGSRLVRCSIRVGVAVLLTALPPDRLTAQVGHDPARSPFRDIGKGAGPQLAVGYLSGERGRVGVGPSDGVTLSARYELPLGGATRFVAGLSYARTSRFVVDPLKDSLSRTFGPVDQDLVLVDVGLQLLLTGGKTWHGLAPYLGASVGMAFGAGSPVDSSGYNFGSKFTLAPGAGVRWYPARRVRVQADARALLFRLKYPLSFKEPSPADGSRVLPLTAPDTDWTAHSWISVGLGWTF